MKKINTKVNMLKFLIVDDQWIVREVLGERVRDTLKAQTFFAESAEEAMSILVNNSEFNAIISDYRMHKATGLDLLRFVVEKEIKAPFALYSSMESLEDFHQPSNFLGVFHNDQFSEMAEAFSQYFLKHT